MSCYVKLYYNLLCVVFLSLVIPFFLCLATSNKISQTLLSNFHYKAFPGLPLSINSLALSGGFRVCGSAKKCLLGAKYLQFDWLEFFVSLTTYGDGI